jgi:hypothetical protein
VESSTGDATSAVGPSLRQGGGEVLIASSHNTPEPRATYDILATPTAQQPLLTSEQEQAVETVPEATLQPATEGAIAAHVANPPIESGEPTGPPSMDIEEVSAEPAPNKPLALVEESIHALTINLLVETGAPTGQTFGHIEEILAEPAHPKHSASVEEDSTPALATNPPLDTGEPTSPSFTQIEEIPAESAPSKHTALVEEEPISTLVANAPIETGEPMSPPLSRIENTPAEPTRIEPSVALVENSHSAVAAPETTPSVVEQNTRAVDHSSPSIPASRPVAPPSMGTR